MMSKIKLTINNGGQLFLLEEGQSQVFEVLDQVEFGYDEKIGTIRITAHDGHWTKTILSGDKQTVDDMTVGYSNYRHSQANIDLLTHRYRPAKQKRREIVNHSCDD